MSGILYHLTSREAADLARGGMGADLIAIEAMKTAERLRHPLTVVDTDGAAMLAIDARGIPLVSRYDMHGPCRSEKP